MFVIVSILFKYGDCKQPQIGNEADCKKINFYFLEQDLLFVIFDYELHELQSSKRRKLTQIEINNTKYKLYVLLLCVGYVQCALMSPAPVLSMTQLRSFYTAPTPNKTKKKKKKEIHETLSIKKDK